jgi:pyrrolidone-carboxylate peptidase
MRALITGFEPFEGSPSNCTELVVRRIAELVGGGGRGGVGALAGVVVSTAVLPVAERACAKV